AGTRTWRMAVAALEGFGAPVLLTASAAVADTGTRLACQPAPRLLHSASPARSDRPAVHRL
ncbi:MAG: hypothetical protein KDI50_13465, partial [Candidatus Competibacteraceae bacterium]|nr:hypothetical protein [Candidatus Competibacteraceae bacterium]